MLTGMATPRADVPPPPLHDLEAEIMEEVWDQRETTVRLVMESLNRTAKPPRAYTTYMTVMRRLADKGLLDRTRVGRGDAYVPRLSREDYRRRRAGAQVEGLIDEFGDVALAQFAKSLSGLDPARRRQLLRLAEEQ
jgi:predicted transcriptional regulator